MRSSSLCLDQRCWSDYRHIGNILLSHLMGAELYIDETERPIEDQGPLEEFMAHLRAQGHTPYLIYWYHSN